MKRRKTTTTALRRWLRFNLVGIIGAVVQLGMLEVLLHALAMDYRRATLVSVEMAILHNFCWHLRYTWRERRLSSAQLVMQRLLEFHLTNGVISLAGSWVLMSVLVSNHGLPVIVANVISIVACSMVNFLVAEVVIFRETRRKRAKSRRTVQSPNCSKRPSVGLRDSFILRSTCTER